MINSGPSASSATASLPLLRVQPRSSARLILQTKAPVWVGTHWAGRQLLCCGAGCPGCDFGPARQVVYFVAKVELTAHTRTVLVEATPRSLEQLKGLACFDGLELEPGSIILATRTKRNTPLQLEPTGDRGSVQANLVPRERCLAAIAALFKLPPTQEGETLAAYCLRAAPAAKHQLVVELMRVRNEAAQE